METRYCDCGGRMRTIDTRDRQKGVYRRRRCDSCGKKVTTLEFISEYYDDKTEEVVLGEVVYNRYKPWRKDV